jgi:hypothetical protein
MNISFYLGAYEEQGAVGFVVIGISLLVLFGTVAIQQPVAAYDHDDAFLIKIIPSKNKDKVIFFDSLGDCHNYVERHPHSGVSRDDCSYR